MGDFMERKKRQIFSTKNQRGQVTIFIIIAILVVAIGVLIYMFFPQIRTGITGETKNPEVFIQTCLEDEIKDAVERLSLRGGSIEPEHYFTYNNINIEYLCYTNENLALCVVQQPLLKQHIESEIEDEIAEEVRNCFSQLEENYENRGFNVNLEQGRTTVELLPKRIVTNFDYVLTLTKAETETHDTFRIVLNNNLYELISIAKSIIEWETTLGEADPRLYMTYYPDLKVEKNPRDDGTNIYIITDRNTEDKFQFASRSLVQLIGF